MGFSVEKPVDFVENPSRDVTCISTFMATQQNYNMG